MLREVPRLFKRALAETGELTAENLGVDTLLIISFFISGHEFTGAKTQERYVTA